MMAGKVAGIDVHKKVLMVVVVDADAPAAKPERRRFTTMPSELCRLSTWLKEHGVKEAVMESTAQYWRPVWLELEPHIRLHLAQAFSNRAPRGRKHDFKDAKRLVRRLIAQELILSFVPDGEQRIWRNLTRMKVQLVRDRVRLQTSDHSCQPGASIRLANTTLEGLIFDGAVSRESLAFAADAVFYEFSIGLLLPDPVTTAWERHR
jgi:transposase